MSPREDAARPEGQPPITNYRKQIEEALRFGHNDATFDSVVAAVQEGSAQYWPLANSVIITQLADGGLLHFWLAGGVMGELKAATPIILAWGKSKGCVTATLTGRRGWLRSFLADTGWRESRIVNMECAL